jgi:hypothetical protein
MAILDIAGQIVDFDAVLEEVHELPAEITSHPVQRGVEVADHVRPGPLVISLRAIVTTTPLRTPSFGAPADRMSSVVDRLRLAQVRGELVTYLGQRGLHEDLAVGDVSAPYTSLRGLEITIRLQQLRVAEAQLVPVPRAATPSGQRLRDRGKQPTEEVEDEESVSMLSKLTGFGTTAN